MPITELHIQGYRTLRDVSWRLGALNVLIGPNGSGKSNLLKSLRLMKHVADARFGDSLIREGGYGAVVWNNDIKELVFGAVISSNDMLGVPATYSYGITVNGSRLVHQVNAEFI